MSDTNNQELNPDEQREIELEQEKLLMEKQGGSLPLKKEPLVKPRVNLIYFLKFFR
jgi:hypothetical protein